MAPMPPTPVAWEVAQLTAEGQEQLLAVLDAHGLIGAPPDYGDYMVTDTNPFVMTVRVDGRDRVHELFQPEASVDDDAADAARV